MTHRFYHRDIVSIKDFSKEDIITVLKTAENLQKGKLLGMLEGKILATCFFEPSTRTRLSFESAMYRLGGKVVGFSDTQTTSVQKGESLIDSIKVIEKYADAIVIRHPQEGAARLAAEQASIPVINGGDGANQHPTQSLLDLYTIYKTLGRLENLSIAITGDLKFGRTIHSLTQILTFFNPRIYFVSPKQLQISEDLINLLKKEGICFSFHEDLEEVIPYVDVLYMSRVQKERMGNLSVSEPYRVTSKFLENAKPNLKILHPLPRNAEIHPDVDLLPSAAYFQQAENGLLIRQALLLLTLIEDFEVVYG